MLYGAWLLPGCAEQRRHTSPVGLSTHTRIHTLGSSQAAGALRYAVDRDYQHSSAAGLPSPHVTEFTFGSDRAPDEAPPGSQRERERERVGGRVQKEERAS